MTKTECPIWGTEAQSIPTSRDVRDIDSPRAGGRYFISRSAEAILGQLDEKNKVKLTSWLVEQRRLGVPCPEVLSNNISEIKLRRPQDIAERADNFLRYISSKSKFIGDFVYYSIRDENNSVINEILSWTGSLNFREVNYLSVYCEDQSWIKINKPISIDFGKDVENSLVLLPPGYSRLSDMDLAGTASKQAFVAMWFNDSMNDAYENGIAPAIREAGYEPLRIDRKDHNNKIDDEIVAEIKRSRFLVADFTQGDDGARGGVYYEAGFAHGHNIPVIFCCREDVISKVHFDTRQYNHITWSDPQILRTRLSQRISATIGDGPLKKAD